MKQQQVSPSFSLSFPLLSSSNISANSSFSLSAITTTIGKEDSKWQPYGNPILPPKPEEIEQQLNNYDLTLPFVQSNPLSTKKEVIPLLRTAVSLASKKANNNFGLLLKNRMLLVKNTHEALLQRREKAKEQVS